MPQVGSGYQEGRSPGWVSHKVMCCSPGGISVVFWGPVLPELGREWLEEIDPGSQAKIRGQGAGTVIWVRRFRNHRSYHANSRWLVDRITNFSTWTQNHLSFMWNTNWRYMLGSWLTFPGALKLKKIEFAGNKIRVFDVLYNGWYEGRI